MNLLEEKDLPPTSREAVVKVIEDMRNRGALTLVESVRFDLKKKQLFGTPLPGSTLQ